jgi:DNA-binding transcriptional MerR regulator
MPADTNPSAPGADEPRPGERISLDQLASLTGLTARTVRYYLQQGLMSKPEGAKRGAYYLPRHVEQLLLVRRWTEAGLSLDRIKELVSGAPMDPPPRTVRPGTVEVWSRVTLVDGLELHIEPGRAELSPEQSRELVRRVTALYRQLREGEVEPSELASPFAPTADKSTD